MGIRFPLQKVLDFQDSGDLGAGSVAGGVAKNFTIPQDADSVIVKFTASITGAGASCFLQTSDDAGTTWYDVARTSVISNAGATAVTGSQAQWIVGTVAGSSGLRTAVNQSASLLTAGIGSAAASTLGSQQVSGMPILGTLNRVFITYTGNVTANTDARAQVLVNSQNRGV